jgi:t-SNARE complex subunit (syntaxin)
MTDALPDHDAPGQWTVDTVRILLTQMVFDLDRRTTRRMDDADKAIQAALAAAEKAVLRAEEANEKRFQGVNEFRAQQQDLIQTFLPRGEYVSAHTAVLDRINALTERISALDLRISSGEGQDVGTKQALAEASRATNTRIAILGTVLTVVFIVVTVVVFVLSH